MTILALPSPRVQADHHADGPTPLEALACTLDEGEVFTEWAVEPAPRYVVQAKHSATLNRTIYQVIDRLEDRLVRWAFTRAEAESVATDLVAEDHEPLLIGGRPWYEAPYPVAEWDGPRVEPTRSESRDELIDRLGRVEHPA